MCRCLCVCSLLLFLSWLSMACYLQNSAMWFFVFLAFASFLSYDQVFPMTRNDLIRLNLYPQYIHSSVDPHRDGRFSICKSHPHGRMAAWFLTRCRKHGAHHAGVPSATQRYCVAGPMPGFDRNCTGNYHLVMTNIAMENPL